MRPDPYPEERLLRWVDGRLSAEERRHLERELMDRPESRALLRQLAEEAVLFGDLGRTTALPRGHGNIIPFPARSRRLWPVALAAALVGVAVLSALWMRSWPHPVARVERVSGALGVFGIRGATERPLPRDQWLAAGDVVTTHSCDSWAELALRDGSRLTVAGRSEFRLLSPGSDAERVRLVRGGLWHNPGSNGVPARLEIQTPTAVVSAGDAQFDLQAGPTETVLRVNRGWATVTHPVGGDAIDVAAGFQTRLTLSPGMPLVVQPQPSPVLSWSCRGDHAAEVVLGSWLPPEEGVPVRLRAEPLLWPLPERPPIVLYAVSLAVAPRSSRPVVLRSGSRVRFEGRTARPMTVRFGFSTQRMRGMYAGKFEVDVPPDSLGPVGRSWTVDLPISSFRSLQPKLYLGAQDLEVIDIYALTLREDAGLELHQVEVLPGDVRR